MSEGGKNEIVFYAYDISFVVYLRQKVINLCAP